MNAPDRWVTISGSCPSLPFLVDWMGERVLWRKAKTQAMDWNRQIERGLGCAACIGPRPLAAGKRRKLGHDGGKGACLPACEPCGGCAFRANEGDAVGLSFARARPDASTPEAMRIATFVHATLCSAPDFQSACDLAIDNLQSAPCKLPLRPHQAHNNLDQALKARFRLLRCCAYFELCLLSPWARSTTDTTTTSRTGRAIQCSDFP